MHRTATIFAAFAVPTLLLVSVPSWAQSIPTTAEQPAQPDASAVVAGNYTVDPAHTQLTWEVNHMGISMLSGMFGASSGSLTLDPDDPASATLEVEFAIGEISVTYPDFADHLLSADFFEVETYPTARFVSTSVEVGSNGSSATIIGDLTIKDISHPVTIEAEFMGAGINPMDEKLHVGFTGSATILRSDFDLGAYAPAVSDDVHLTLNAAFVAE